ncbi:MAG: DMT family transporter [Phormidesmis sp.]
MPGMTSLLTVIGAIEGANSGFENGFIGEIAALTAAFLWAAATLMFGQLGRQLSPLVLNLVKGLFAVVFILLTLAMRQALSGAVVGFSLPLRATLYLIVSGGIGIGLGDTAYFSAINTLGARRALLLETLAPPMTALMAWMFLSEQLSIISVIGICLTLIGIAWVISERVLGVEHVKWGVGLKVALLAVFCQATGAVLSRAALVDAAVDPLWSSLLRLVAGLAFMGLLATVQPYRLGEYLPLERQSDVLSSTMPLSNIELGSWQVRWQKSLSALKRPALLGAVALAAFFATYLGIWLQQIALKHTAAGIAQALLATSPLFVLPMAAALGDRPSLRSTLGAAIALVGVWILLA